MKYGLLILALLSAAIGLKGPWYNVTLTVNASLPGPDSLILIKISSYGCLVVAISALILKHYTVSYICSSIMVALLLAYPFHLAWQTPNLLHQIVDQGNAYRDFLQFCVDFCPMVDSLASEIPKLTKLETIWDRLHDIFIFINHKWYFALIASVLALHISFACVRLNNNAGEGAAGLISKPVLKWVWIPFITVGTMLFLEGRTPIAVQFIVNQALTKERTGHTVGVLAELEKARKRDQNYGLILPVLLSEGHLLQLKGRLNEPQSLLYKADLSLANNETEAALYLLTQAENSLITRRAATRLMRKALMDRAGQAIRNENFSSAKDDFLLLKKHDQDDLLIDYYIAYCDYYLGNYELALHRNLALSERVTHVRVKAILEASLGDCYTQLDLFQSARNHYRNSISLSTGSNTWGLIALNGS